MISEHFSEEQQELHGISIRITTYKIGEEFYCHVSNIDPGATISRSVSLTREGAQLEAMRKATERLKPKH